MNTEKQFGKPGFSPTEPHNKKELAQLLGVSVFILNKMIALVKEELGEPIGTVYSVNQVQFLINRYGIKR